MKQNNKLLCLYEGQQLQYHMGEDCEGHLLSIFHSAIHWVLHVWRWSWFGSLQIVGVTGKWFWFWAAQNQDRVEDTICGPSCERKSKMIKIIQIIKLDYVNLHQCARSLLNSVDYSSGGQCENSEQSSVGGELQKINLNHW